MSGARSAADGNNYVPFYTYIESFACRFFRWDGVLLALCCTLYFYMVKLMHPHRIVHFDVNLRFENEDNAAIEIEGDGEDSGEIEISGVLEATEEEPVLLEPPANSIDEGYVEALNDGTLEPTSNTSSDSSSEEQYEDDDVEDLKQQLIDTLYGTERGLRASSDTRAEVIELITQLEAKNPTEAPTAALTLLNGKWVLAYVFHPFLHNEN